MSQHNHNTTEPPSISRNTFLGMAWAGVAVSFCFLLFRIYVRLKIFRRLFIDDPFLIVAWLMTLANAIIWQVTVGPLYLTVGVASGQITSLPQDFVPKFFAYSHAQLSSYIIYYSSLYLTKFSFLLFFRKLGNKVKRQRVIWWSALLFVIASYAVSFGLGHFRCLVGSKATAILYCASPQAASYENISLRTAGSLDIATDASIILVSTNILWKIQINVRKKLVLAVICSLTAFIICVSITRVIVSTDGTRFDVLKQIFWANLELSVAIIVACLASFRTLYTRSDRTKNLPPIQHHAGETRIFSGGSNGPTHSSSLGNAISIAAREDTYELREPRSSTSTEGHMLPFNGVYVHHDFSVLPEPGKAYIPAGNTV